MREDAEECYEIAREQLKIAAERRKRNYDMKIKEAEFSVGHWVWYWYPRRYQKRSPKWQQMYTGPYLIIRFIGPVNYVLQKTPRSKPFVVHTDKLKMCFGPTPTSWLRAAPDNEHASQQEIDKCSSDVVLVETGNDTNLVSENMLNTSEWSDSEKVRGERCKPRRINRKAPKRFDDYAK